MRNAPLAVAAIALLSAAARAETPVDVRLHVGLPASPKLVAVERDVLVVADVPEQVFMTRGSYWIRRDGRWYSAKAPATVFAVVDVHRVPRAVVALAEAPVAAQAAAPATAPREAPAQAPGSGAYTDVVRAKELKADRVVARVVYAKVVHARDGEVLRVVRDEKSKEWERGGGKDELDVPEVQADVIYARELDAGWLQADEVHAQKVKIGP